MLGFKCIQYKNENNGQRIGLHNAHIAVFVENVRTGHSSTFELQLF